MFDVVKKEASNFAESIKEALTSRRVQDILSEQAKIIGDLVERVLELEANSKKSKSKEVRKREIKKKKANKPVRAGVAK